MDKIIHQLGAATQGWIIFVKNNSIATINAARCDTFRAPTL
ncbi:hypothetical protein [Sporosarcina sp. ITBMC105]